MEFLFSGGLRRKNRLSHKQVLTIFLFEAPNTIEISIRVGLLNLIFACILIFFFNNYYALFKKIKVEKTLNFLVLAFFLTF